MSSALLACLRKRQKVSSRSCREMFSNARRWSPGRSGGEIKRKNRWTVSPSRLAKSTPARADRHGAHQAIDAGVLGVRDGHAAADAGAAQFLALQDGLDDALELARPRPSPPPPAPEPSPEWPLPCPTAFNSARMAPRHTKSANFMHVISLLRSRGRPGPRGRSHASGSGRAGTEPHGLLGSGSAGDSASRGPGLR